MTEEHRVVTAVGGAGADDQGQAHKEHHLEPTLALT
jgi:hypothetical protein